MDMIFHHVQKSWQFQIFFPSNVLIFLKLKKNKIFWPCCLGLFLNSKVTNCHPNKNPLDDHILQREKRKKAHTKKLKKRKMQRNFF